VPSIWNSRSLSQPELAACAAQRRRVVRRELCQAQRDVPAQDAVHGDAPVHSQPSDAISLLGERLTPPTG
jgi:hypothetical protein